MLDQRKKAKAAKEKHDAQIALVLEKEQKKAKRGRWAQS